MRENRVKRALKRGEVVIGTMISEMRNPSIASMLATAGFQFMYIDMEHGAYNLETVYDIIVAAQAADIVPIVRVSELESHLLSRPLDAGAMGLLIPHTETREEVDRIINITKYFPLGERGMSLRRIATGFARVKPEEFMRQANEETMVVIQIESAKAIDNIEELVSVKGVDAAFIGPADLSQSLGIPGQTTHPRVVECFHKVIEACKNYGVAPGIHVYDMETAKKWIAEGMRLIAYGSDIAMIVDTGTKWIQELSSYIKKG